MVGASYRFDAPGDWLVERSGRTLTVGPESADVAVSVTTFRLGRPFRPALWRPVVSELDDVAGRLARELGAVVSNESTVEIAGRRARSYELSGARDGTRRVAFLLRGRLEYQLLCRGKADPETACEQLLATFRLA